MRIFYKLLNDNDVVCRFNGNILVRVNFYEVVLLRNYMYLGYFIVIFCLLKILEIY